MPPLVKAQTALKNKTKIWRKTIFNMADGILTPYNVERWWHWFRQVTAPCNVACGSGIMTVNYTTWQHPVMWYVDLGWHAVEFARLQHRAMWHVALKSWHWIHQVGWHTMEFAQTSAILKFYISFDFDYITAVDIQCAKSCPNWTILSRKKWRHVDFQDRGSQPSWILWVQQKAIMSSLKTPCTTSYRSSIDTIALNCLVFEKIAFILYFSNKQTDILTNKQTNKQMH